MNEITSTQHTLIKEARHIFQKQHKRKQQGLVFFSGDHLFNEWLGFTNTYPLHTLFCLKDDPRILPFLQTHPLLKKQIKFCSPHILCHLAQVGRGQNPPPSLLVHSPKEFKLNKLREPSFLILDRLQDPGNVGTLLRSADAFGVKSVFALKGSCDLWSPKVFSAARGSHFRLQLKTLEVHECLEFLTKKKIPLFCADCQGQSLQSTLPKEANFALAVGNEGQGLCEPLREYGKKVRLDISKEVDSLNAAVAGSILLYYFTKGTAKIENTA